MTSNGSNLRAHSTTVTVEWYNLNLLGSNHQHYVFCLMTKQGQSFTSHVTVNSHSSHSTGAHQTTTSRMKASVQPVQSIEIIDKL
jgi:hypothetical protein